MRHRIKITIAAALALLLLLAIWLTCRSALAQQNVRVGFVIAHGHFPEPGRVYADHLIIAWVTNTGHSSITLDNPYAIFEKSTGGLVQNHGSSWYQVDYSVNLSPASAAWLAHGFEPDKKRLKLLFDYHWPGGPFHKFLSQAGSKFFLKWLPQKTHDWLRQNGMIDGTIRRRYESDWITNQYASTNVNHH